MLVHLVLLGEEGGEGADRLGREGGGCRDMAKGKGGRGGPMELEEKGIRGVMGGRGGEKEGTGWSSGGWVGWVTRRRGVLQ